MCQLDGLLACTTPCSLINPDGEREQGCTQDMRRSLKRRAKTGFVHIQRPRIWASGCAYVETPAAAVVVLPVGLAEPVVEPAEAVGVLVEPAAKVAYRPPCRIGVCIRLFFVSHPRVAAWLALIPGDKGELSDQLQG